MSFKKQLMNIKENWLIITLVIVLVFVFISGSSIFKGISENAAYSMQSMTEETLGFDKSIARGPSSPVYDSGDFAPEVEERKITKTATISSEVERGEFKKSENRLNNIIISAEALLLNQNVNKYGTKLKSYYTGRYQIKVDVKKYESFIAQIKEIGEVQSFNENALDITGRYEDLEIEIQSEKDRLKRYLEMYNEAEKIEDKISLNDRIFNLERSIKYMEDSLEKMDQKIEYSTVYLTLTEERSKYLDITFVKFSELVKSCVGSLNILIKLLVIVLPWAVIFFIIKFIVKKIKK